MKNNTSEEWKHPGNRQELLRSALLQAMGYTDIDISKPIIGIVNTWAETFPPAVRGGQAGRLGCGRLPAGGQYPVHLRSLL